MMAGHARLMTGTSRVALAVAMRESERGGRRAPPEAAAVDTVQVCTISDQQQQERPAVSAVECEAPPEDEIEIPAHCMEALVSSSNRISEAMPDDKPAVFQREAREIVDILRSVNIENPEIADRLQQAADAYDVTDECGQDNVQAWIAAAMDPEIPIVRLSDAPTVDGPIPLIPELAPSTAFPVNALGSVLAPAARAIAGKVQAPIEIAAQSVLAAASLAVQAIADVRMPFGQTRPLSLCFVTIASSGARKTTTDAEALWPIRKRETFLAEEYSRDIADHKHTLAAWEAEQKKIESDKKLDFESRKAKLRALGSAPRPPLHPYLTAPEPTIEGLLKNWPDMPPSLGLFSAEGGQFIGGHGMSQDHRLKTAAALSELWDGRAPRRIRAGDGISDLRGKRLAVHLMVQPNVSVQFLSDASLRDQGLLSRVLVAAPGSIAGSRLYRDTSPADETAIKSYGVTILRLLERTLALAPGTHNELTPRVIIFSPEAEAQWREFYDHIERQSAPGGELSAIPDFAGKAAEHAARLAGVLAVVEHPDTGEISADIMSCAVTLADWYVSEALRLAAVAMTSPVIARAQRLLIWLQERPAGEVAVRDICREGPPDLRQKAAAEEGVRVLCEHGWLNVATERPKRYRLARGGAR